MSGQNTLGSSPSEVLSENPNLENPEVQSVTSRTSGEITSNLSSSQEFLHGKRGLIIDQDDGSGFYAQTLLSKLGAQTVILKNVENAENSMSNQNIDFVIFCPRFDRNCSEIYQEDIDFLNLMKEKHSDVQIILYTAHIMSNEIELQNSLGVAGIIRKPAQKEEFHNTMKKLRPDLIELEKGLSLEKN